MILKLLALAILFSSSCIAQTTVLKPGDFSKVALKEIKPAHRTFVKNTASKARSQKMDEPEIRRMVVDYTSKNNLFNGTDIDALVVLVMESVVAENENDLKELVESVNANNKKKQQVRDLISELHNSRNGLSRQKFDSINTVFSNIDRTPQSRSSKTPVTRPVTNNNVSNVNLTLKAPTAAEIDQLIKTMMNKLESLSALGEAESLRLQMAMDRMSKMMSTLSNILKKIHDTQSQIIQNLK